jgi:transcriptional regulator with XRE-family HTH domain
MRLRRLREIRERLGWTQEDLARAANLSRRRFSDWERGENIRVSSARKLAAALGVEIVDLIGGAVERPELPTEMVEGLMGDLMAAMEREMVPVEVEVAGGRLGVGSLRDHRQAADRLRRFVRAVEANEEKGAEAAAVMAGVDGLVRARKLVTEQAPDHPAASDLDELAEEVSGLLSDLKDAYRTRAAEAAKVAEGLAPTA